MALTRKSPVALGSKPWVKSHFHPPTNTYHWLSLYSGASWKSQVNTLEELDLPHVHVEYDGTHIQLDMGLTESIIFFSEIIGGGVVAVESKAKLATTWATLKSR